MNAPPVIDIEQRVNQFVRLRDKIKDIEERHKEELRPYKETQELLSGALMGHLNNINADSVKTGAGTVYRSSRKSASLSDPKVFFDFVKAHELWDLMDRKANATAVADYIEQNQVPPPGVNFNVQHTIGVRRA